MKNIFSKTSVLLGAVALVAGFGVQTNANAADPYTVCVYTLISGAPWADESKTNNYPGHITCPATAHVAIGGYALSYQSHR